MSWVKHTDARANPHRPTWGKLGFCLGHHVQSRLDVRNAEQLPELQGEMQPQAGRRHVEIAAEELPQLVEAVEDGMAVQAEVGGGLFDRAADQVSLECLQELFAVAQLSIHERPKAVDDETLGEAGGLGQNQMGDDLVVAVHDSLRGQLAPCLSPRTALEIRTR